MRNLFLVHDLFATKVNMQISTHSLTHCCA